MEVIPGYAADTVAAMEQEEKREAACAALEQPYDLDGLTDGVPYERRHDCSAGIVCLEQQEDIPGFPDQVSRPAYTDIEQLWVDEDGLFATQRDGPSESEVCRYRLLFSFDRQTRFAGELPYRDAGPVELRIYREDGARTLEVADGTTTWTTDTAVQDPAAASADLTALETLDALYRDVYRPSDASPDYRVITDPVNDALQEVPVEVQDSFWNKTADLEANLELGLAPHQCQLQSVNTLPALLEMYLGRFKVLWIDDTQVPDDLLPGTDTLYAADIWQEAGDRGKERLHKHSEIRVSKNNPDDDMRTRRERFYRSILPDDLLHS